MINEFLFADADCALNSTSEAGIQKSNDKFWNACDNFGLTVSTKKTCYTLQPQGSRSTNQILPSKDSVWRWWTNWPILAALCHSQPPLTMKLMLGLQKGARPLGDYTSQFGVAEALKQSPYRTDVKLGQPTKGTAGNSFSYYLPKKNPGQ